MHTCSDLIRSVSSLNISASRSVMATRHFKYRQSNLLKLSQLYISQLESMKFTKLMLCGLTISTSSLDATVQVLVVK